MTRDLTALQAINERELAKRIGQVEREITAIYREAREQIRNELSRTYEKYSIDGELTYADMTKYNRNVQLERRLDKIINDANASATAKMNRLAPEQYEEAFFRQAWAFDQNIGVQLQWGRINREQVRAAIENPLDKIAQRRLRAMSRERIRSAVASGLVRGQSFPAMAREIGKAINGSRYDALRIARTEGGRAQSIGTRHCHERAEEIGIEGNRYWIATLDGRTRDSHGELDGEPMDREHGGWRIPESNEYTPGPRESGPPEFVINCRCSTEYRVDDIPPDVRRIRDEGIQPYITYSEWWEDRGKAMYGRG